MTADSPLPEIVPGLYDVGASPAPTTGPGSPPATTYAYFLTAQAVSPTLAPTLREAWSDPALVGWFIFLAAPIVDGDAFVAAGRSALPDLGSTSQPNLRAVVWLNAPDDLSAYDSLVFYQLSPPLDPRTPSQPPYTFGWAPLSLAIDQGVSIGFDFEALAFTITTDPADTGSITLNGYGGNFYWYSTNPYTWTFAIPLVGDGAGAFRTSIGLDLGMLARDFGCCVRYVHADAGDALGLDYPFYAPAAPGASLPGFAVRLHPLFPTHPGWTRFQLDFGGATPNQYQTATRGLQASYFLTTAGGAITVAPIDRGGDEQAIPAGFAFCTGPVPQSPALVPPSSQLYLAPVGPHQIVSVARPSGSPDAPGLPERWMCGLTALEYLEIVDGDVLELVSPMPAYVPQTTTPGATGLDPAFTTSWVRFPSGATNGGRRYFGQPSASVYYAAAPPGECAPPVDALLATLTTPIVFPAVPYGGITIGPAMPASAFSRLESRGLAGERHTRATAASPGPVFLPPTSFHGALLDADLETAGAATAVTPQGFVVQLNSGGGAAGTWNSIEFARSPEDGTQYLSLAGAGSPPVVGTDIATLLMQNELFLVVSDATLLGTFANELTLAGFNFLLDVGTGDGPVDSNATILIFKYSTSTSLVDLAKRTDLWAGAGKFVRDLAGTQRQIEIAIEAAQPHSPTGAGDSISRRFAAAAGSGARGGSPPDTDPFANFRAIAESPDWTGVLALNCAIDGSGMPLDLQMLLGGINGELRAHHFGIQRNQLAFVEGAAAIDQSSIFGVIAYPSLTQPAPPVDTTDDFDYELELLTVVFSNSKITDFKVRVGLTINRLFGRAVQLMAGGDVASPVSPANTLQIPGRYQLQDGIATVSFSTTQPFVYDFPVPFGTSRVLDQVVFDRATLVPVSSAVLDSPVAGSPMVTRVTARFDLGGALWFNPSPFPGAAGGLDLFSYGRDPDTLSSGLPLDNLAVNLAFSLDEEGGIVGKRQVTGDLSRLTLTSTPGAARPGSLLYSLPLQLSKFLYSPSGFTAASLGASPVHVLQLEGTPISAMSPVISPLLPATTQAPNVTTAPQYGLEFDMPLGSLGALSNVSVGLMAKLVIAWGASRVVPDTDAAAVLVQLPQVFAGYGSFQLQGILKTTFGDANLLMVELDDGPVYAVMFNNIQLSVLGYGFPPGIVIDFILFAGERGTAAGGQHPNLAWFLGAFKPQVSPPGAS